MPEIRTYLSKRGFPLLFVQPPLDVPVLTAENYDKWYELYLVQPDGSVTQVDSTAVLDVADKHPDARWVDHLYHPRLLYRLAKHLGAELDERLLEVATGRWIFESEDGQFPAELFSDPFAA